jgi:hypothetical protein
MWLDCRGLNKMGVFLAKIIVLVIFSFCCEVLPCG